MAMKRQLAAIMFTDITGYSAMMGADEDYARRIRNRHRKVFKETHEVHGGRILQYYGDGTLSIFESAAAAVECAVDMQIEFRKEPEVPLRIGIHTGDISYDEEGAYGDGLNIASRIERLCIPGGVYISAKVYDDIKNHKWLTAISLGDFRLRNIYREVEIYAVTAKGLTYPTEDELQLHPEYSIAQKVESRVNVAAPIAEATDQAAVPLQGRKRKGVAVLIAFFFGFFGIHRLYLGQHKRGMIHLVLSIVAIVLTDRGIDQPIAPAAIFGIIWLVDLILLAAMSREDFEIKYNSGQVIASKQKVKDKPPAKHARVEQTMPAEGSKAMRANPALIRGIEFYKEERYHEAMREFHKALEFEPSSPAAYFNLACCSSILLDLEAAYHYLSEAVEAGFDDYERIEEHEALASLRQHPDFRLFVENNYHRFKQLPEPAHEDLLESLDKFNPEVLDRLEELGDQLEKGEMTREQFEVEKKRILGHD